MVGNHVADIVERYGADSSTVPAALTDVHQGAQELRLQPSRQAGNPSTDFVPDEIVDRFCILGPRRQHLERMSELRAPRR
jgi:hypothetical protein